VASVVRVGETNLMVLAPCDVTDSARRFAVEARAELHAYRKADPAFFESLEPRQVAPDAPPVVREMARAGAAAGVGPMAAVAGAIAERVGRGLLAELAGDGAEVIVENGGDVFMKTTVVRRAAIFAGESPLSGRLAIEIDPVETPLGLATSSATVGPSLSFGSADAAVVLAADAALADAVATGLGNRVRARGDIAPALGWALDIEGVAGAIVILGEHFGAQGKVRLRPAGV